MWSAGWYILPIVLYYFMWLETTPSKYNCNNTKTYSKLCYDISEIRIKFSELYRKDEFKYSMATVIVYMMIMSWNYNLIKCSMYTMNQWLGRFLIWNYDIGKFFLLKYLISECYVQAKVSLCSIVFIYKIIVMPKYSPVFTYSSVQLFINSIMS